MDTPLAATTARHTRGRRSHRCAGAPQRLHPADQPQPVAQQREGRWRHVEIFSAGHPHHGPWIGPVRHQQHRPGEPGAREEVGASQLPVRRAQESELVDGEPDEGEVQELDVRRPDPNRSTSTSPAAATSPPNAHPYRCAAVAAAG